MVKEKLKLVKQDIKLWNKTSFGKIGDNILMVMREIKQLDEKGETGSFSGGDILKRRELFQSFWELSKMRDSIAFQKSSVNWLQLGDANSSFFHACVNKRRRENAVHGIRVQGQWVEDPKLVKEGIFNHFQSQLIKYVGAGQCWMRSFLTGYRPHNQLCLLQSSLWLK